MTTAAPARPVLALDPATKTGWAHTDGTSGSWALAARSGDHEGQSHLRLANLVAGLIKTKGCGLLAFESSPFMGTDRTAATLSKGSEFRGVLLLVAARLEVPVLTVNPMTLKAWATGSGRAKKEQMRQAYRRFWNIDVPDPDECDALWVWRYAEHYLDRGAPNLTPRKKPRARRPSSRSRPLLAPKTP